MHLSWNITLTFNRFTTITNQYISMFDCYYSLSIDMKLRCKSQANPFFVHTPIFIQYNSHLITIDFHNDLSKSNSAIAAVSAAVCRRWTVRHFIATEPRECWRDVVVVGNKQGPIGVAVNNPEHRWSSEDATEIVAQFQTADESQIDATTYVYRVCVP